MDLGNILFGGLTASRNPNDYQVTNPQQAGINNLMGRGSAQLDPSQQAQFRAMQLQQAQQLARIASGQQEGAGELAAQRQVQNALAAQQAQARMARGGQNAALAFRQGARNAAGIGLAGAGQAQQAAMQDQMNAQGMLGNVLGQGRQQDIGVAGQNAYLQNDRYGQNLGALTGLNAQDLQGEYNSMNAATSQQGILGGLLNTGGQVLGSYLGGRGGGGGGTPMSAPGGDPWGNVPPTNGTVGGYASNVYNSIFSDETLKTDISGGDDDINDMLSKLSAKTYRYKDEERHGEGKRAGVMAQDLMRSKAGAAMVMHTPEGLAIDPTKAISAALASMAHLHKRVTDLEGKRG